MHTAVRKRLIVNFYREEFRRHRERLEAQRVFFEEKAYEEVETVVDRLISEMETICEVENFEELASNLLQRIDIVTNLSASKVAPGYRVH